MTMKKSSILAACAALVLVLIALVAMGIEPRAADVAPITSTEEAAAVVFYPEDPNGPLSPEQKAATEIVHSDTVDPDMLEQFDADGAFDQLKLELGVSTNEESPVTPDTAPEVQ